MDQLQAFHRLSSQVQILYNQSVLTFLFPILFVPAICLLLWDISSRIRLLVWSSVVILFSLARYLMIWMQRRERISTTNVNKWLDLFTASVFISGAMWGSATIILIPYTQGNTIEYTIYNGLIMLIVCGLVAGALVAYSISKRVLLFYAFPALVPPAFYMVSLGDQYNSALGGFVLMYFVFITATSFRLNTQLTYYLDIEYQMIHMAQKIRLLQDQLQNIPDK